MKRVINGRKRIEEAMIKGLTMLVKEKVKKVLRKRTLEFGVEGNTITKKEVLKC